MHQTCAPLRLRVENPPVKFTPIARVAKAKPMSVTIPVEPSDAANPFAPRSTANEGLEACGRHGDGCCRLNGAASRGATNEAVEIVKVVAHLEGKEPRIRENTIKSC